MTPHQRRQSDPRAEALLVRFAERFPLTEGPVPVDSIASDLLGLLVTDRDEMEVSGLLIPDQRRVYLNARESRENDGRRRFTLAHEIGHWVCQCNEGSGPAPEPILCREADMSAKIDTAIEREANNFAASLLMPEAAVRATAARGIDVDHAAVHFGVSDIAMEWRYFNLGITHDRPWGA
ncbi:MAG: ImmA/IrrE family metallo-endopeptidase [Thermoleophilia bacterium]|nr:ImmA/IrrE family metallo-endopeptidase [Thermoleophilia bacterium]